MLLAGPLTASFPTCNCFEEYSRAFKVSFKCFQVVPSLQACELVHQSEIRISCRFCHFLFLPKGGIFGARILFMVFPFYFKGNKDKLLRQRTDVRKKSVCCFCSFLLIEDAMQSEPSLF